MPKSKAQDYKKLNEQLNEIIAWFEAGENDVEEAIAKYEQAIEIIAKIEKYLKTAENRLRKLKVKLD